MRSTRTVKLSVLVWLLGSCLASLAARGEQATVLTNMSQSLSGRTRLEIHGAKTQVDPYACPVEAIAALTPQSAADTSAGAQVRVQGTVLDQRIGEYIVVRDGTGIVFAESPQIVAVNAQDRVDVWGTPVWDGTRLRLKKATFRLVDSGNPPEQLAPAPDKPAELPLLSKAIQVRDLAPDKAAWKYPVRLRGVVTLCLPSRGKKFYVQDDTSGIYVRLPQSRPNLKPGDLVEIVGVSNPGGFAPIVVVSNLTVLGAAALPEPARATPFQMASGQYNCQWIEARGVVSAFSLEGGLLQLKFSNAGGVYFAYIPAASAPTNLLDAIIHVDGVCASQFNSKRQITGSAIWAQSMDFLQIEEPGAENPLDLPTQPILSLSQFRPRGTLQRRVKVAGVVTLRQSDQSFFVQDGSDAVQVLSSRKAKVEPGDRVIVAGYPGLGDYSGVLRDAVFRVEGRGAVPQPKQLTSADGLDPDLDDTWVQVEARLLNQASIGPVKVLTLQLPGWIFEAHCLSPGEGANLPPAGSLVRLTGVYRIMADEARAPVSFQLLVPSLGNVQVLEEPSWWKLQYTMTVVGVMAVVVLAAVLWVMLLRRQVREQTSSLQQSELKFRSLVEQSLVGVYVIQDGRFAYVNPRLAEIFGYSPEEMISTCTVLDTVFEEDRALVEDQVRRRIVNEATTVHYGFRGRRKDGSLVFVEVLGNRTDYGGKPAVLGTLLDISERKRAEDELFNSRQMLRTVLDTIPQRVFWKDRNAVYVGCNKALAEDCGYADPNELIGKTDHATRSAEMAERYQADDRQVMETGLAKSNYEEPQIRRDGTRGWLKTSKVPLFDKNGKVIGVLGTYEDISERKRDEAALAEASSLLEALLGNSPDHIYFKDRESRFVRYSKSFAELLHLPDADFMKGKTDFDIFTEEHARPAYEDEQEIIRTGQPLIGKLEKETHADGRVTWALTTKLPWHDKDRNIIGTFGISKDVTAIKEVESRLAYERELFRALLDNLPDAIYFKDRESRFVRLGLSKVERSRQILLQRYRAANPSDDTAHLPAHLTDVQRFGEYLIGKTDFDVYPEERARSAYVDEQEIIRSGQPIIGKPEHVKLVDGKVVWVLTTKMPWRDENGNIVGTFGVSRDITALKEAEGQLESVHQRLVETSRLAGMAEVATDVLHNVGNVLNSVNVSCSLTMERLRASKASSLAKVSALLEEHRGRLGEFFSSDPRGQQLPGYLAALAEHLTGEQATVLNELEQLLKHIDHIKQIVAMQQSYAKVAGVLETISASQLVEDALHINGAALVRHDVHVRRQFHETPPILTEKHKVLQILVNLIRNAKYALDDSKRQDKLLLLKVGTDENGYIKIQVVDNGVGIPAENLTRIFSHGFTTRRNGHGFGLHSSALAVRELGGSLHAHSDGAGAGATFTLLLPQQPLTRTQSASDPAPVSESASKET
jgi:PAS domain S-box-containing protein